MATKAEILENINKKIISNGNILATDTNTILKDILDFADKPTSNEGFDFGNLDNPLLANDFMSVKINFSGIQKFSCNAYICVETKFGTSIKKNDGNLVWIYMPLKDEEYKTMRYFLPNINNKEMYLTFAVPFYPREFVSDATRVSNQTRNGSSSMTTIIGIGLLKDKQGQGGVHLIIPEAGHISTSIALSYKPNNFDLNLFSPETKKQIDNAFQSIIEDNNFNSVDK